VDMILYFFQPPKSELRRSFTHMNGDSLA